MSVALHSALHSALPPAMVREDGRTWSLAAAVAVGAHLAAAVAVLTWSRPAPPLPPEPVVLVELPAGDTLAPAAASESPAQAAPQAAPRPAAMPPQPTPAPAMLTAPPARVPLPLAPVTLPAQTLSSPVRQAAPAPVPPAAAPSQAAATPAGAGSGNGSAGAGDPRAKAAEVDYFSLLSAYLNRRKTYPAEARRARQEGVVVVRFTVNRDGAVSGTAIRRSSGHDLLDQATLDLLARVAPLPRMPATMQRQTVSLALPIAYTLKTS